MNSSKVVEQVDSDDEFSGVAVPKKVRKLRLYLVSEEDALAAFSNVNPHFAAQMQLVDAMAGWQRWVRKDLRRYRRDPEGFDFDQVWYDFFYEDAEMEFEEFKEDWDEVQWATNASHPACFGPESGAIAPPLEAQRRVIRQRGADMVRTAEDQAASLEPPTQQDPRLSELFSVLNEKYFEGLLPLVPVLSSVPGTELEGIQNGLTRYKYRKGKAYVGGDLKIYLADSIFKPIFSNEADRWKVVADTLVHEMAHLAVHVDSLGEEILTDGGHGQRFTDECNRINQAIGGPEVHPDDGNEDCGDHYNLGSTLWPTDDSKKSTDQCSMTRHLHPSQLRRWRDAIRRRPARYSTPQWLCYYFRFERPESCGGLAGVRHGSR
jgi:hypothetical protein